jgi:molybdenum cofactor cytidylyltransferase
MPGRRPGSNKKGSSSNMDVRVTHCAILILAAGQSSRLGSPKQLLEYHGTSLVKRVAQTALDSAIGPVAIVLGANANRIGTELDMPDLCLIENRDWQEGMASSIRAGVKAITDLEPDTDGIIILVCDQPHLEGDILKQLLQVQKDTGLPVAASVYVGKTGTPAVFHKSFFPLLMELKGDTGARKLFSEYSDQVALLPFEKGIIDIDTKEDYDKLIHNK